MENNWTAVSSHLHKKMSLRLIGYAEKEEMEMTKSKSYNYLLVQQIWKAEDI